jgi:hypothetical protein
VEALKLCRQWAASFTHERRKGAPLTKEVPVAADPSPRRACLLGAIVGHIGDGIAGAFAAVSLRGGGQLRGGVEEMYYRRSIRIGEWLAYPPKLTVELGSYVDGEAHGWAR